MQWTRSAVVAGLVALVMISCGPSGPSETELAQEAEWASLQEEKKALDDMRQELTDLRQQVAEAPAEEDEAAPEGEGEGEGAGEPAPTEADVEALANKLAEKADEFGGRLVTFLNDDPMIEGEPPTERQLAALHMKSDEDIALAQEWIDKGGDYKRAIDIYNNALRFDPGNEAVEAALAKAEADRYMSEERFKAAKKGMTEAEVRAVLGQVNLHNVKPFPDREVTAWFYPTAADGAAAAVWFEEKGGVNKVYRLNFTEVKPRGEAEAG